MKIVIPQWAFAVVGCACFFVAGLSFGNDLYIGMVANASTGTLAMWQAMRLPA